MRIESTDASNVSRIPVSDTGQNNVSNVSRINTEDTANRPSNNQPSKSQQKPPDEVVIQAIEKANKSLAVALRRLDFSVHEKTNSIMVKVVNTETDEIVREFPSEKILDMVAKMWEMAGIIVDERR